MIANVAELREQFKVELLDDDHRLLALLIAAEDYAKRFCGTVLEAEAITEYHDGDGTDIVLLRNFPVNSITSVHDDVNRDYAAASLIAATEYMIESSGRLILENGVFNVGRQNVKVVYNAGYSVVPYDLKVAVCNIAFSNYLEANGSINMVEGEEVVYRPAKLRAEATRLLEPFKKLV